MAKWDELCFFIAFTYLLNVNVFEMALLSYAMMQKGRRKPLESANAIPKRVHHLEILKELPYISLLQSSVDVLLKVER